MTKTIGLLLFVAVGLTAAGAGGMGYYAGRTHAPAARQEATSETAPRPAQVVPDTKPIAKPQTPAPTPPAEDRKVAISESPKAAEADKPAARAPSLEDVLRRARKQVKAVNDKEPADTERRFNRETSSTISAGMQNLINEVKQGKQVTYQMATRASQLGLVEMYQCALLKNPQIESNTGLKSAIEAHYDRSLQGGKLNLDDEALWIVNAWIAIGITYSEDDVTESCEAAASYFKTGRNGLLRSARSKAIHKQLTDGE